MTATMNRRDFITLLGGAAVAWPLAASAQQPSSVRRIGVLMGWNESDREAQSNLAHLFRNCSNWAGQTVATCGSTIVGPMAT
jgi:hypothetical protein